MRRIHCLGAGGMGMGPLAIYLSGLGFEVSGEDDGMGEEMLARLRAAGVRVGEMGPEAEIVTYSSAIGPRHPAMAEAARRGLPQVRRGELLAEAARGLKLVAVCGAHGKTTTTAMLITALRAANFPAGYILGGLWADGGAPARAGSNDWVVAEIDESDGTIGSFSPEITLTVNLDWDHPDFYRDPADLERTFAALFARTRGPVLVSDADPRSLRVSAAARERLTFGRSGDFAATLLEENAAGLKLSLGGRFPGTQVSVGARGEFNAANAAGALAAAALMGVPPAARALADYPGVKRRQSVLSRSGGITVLEDYAHHPAEIRALLGSLRRQTRGRLWAVFQPHRYSRTAQFAAEFAAALAVADHVHLLDVYPAGEAPVPGGTSADIYAEMRRTQPGTAVSYMPGAKGLAGWTGAPLGEGDILAFVGAGDIERHACDWLAEREKLQAAAAEWDRIAAEWKAGLSPEARLRREEPLARRTTLRVGGAARLYAEPANEADVAHLLSAAHRRGIRVFGLGRGSNLIVPDEGVDGLVLCLAHAHWSRFEPQPDGSVRVGAGLRLKNLCGLAAAAGLSGFEFLEGIPGSVGGSLRMNAGAMGGWIFDVVESVEVADGQGRLLTLRRAEMHVDYRHCAELHHALALGAVLRPKAAQASADIAGRIDEYRRRRHETQPREPSAGCIFKNPPGTSAGRLIDEAGLKGERIGGAEISPVHANFIINRGEATSADVLALIRRVRARVRQERGVELEPEVLLYGRDWQEVL
ncbi:MAG TPA: UDP-N-acetylmuramate dehydrogenase [Opitutaceae bacterium]|nr:UDP-N-acetylmuramate dehydrogenase [Opitutaceae bacterium]